MKKLTFVAIVTCTFYCSVNIKLLVNQVTKKTVEKELTLAEMGCILDATEAEGVRHLRIHVCQQINVNVSVRQQTSEE